MEGVEREVLHDKDDVLVHCDAAHPPPLHIHRHLSVSVKKNLYLPKKIGNRQKNRYPPKKDLYPPKRANAKSMSLYPPQVGLCLSPNLGANCKPAEELSSSPLRLLTLLD